MGKALIADETGLGKTVQALAVASAYMPKWPLLIITPSAAKYHWKREIYSWLGDEIPEDCVTMVDQGKANLSHLYKTKQEDSDEVEVIEVIENNTCSEDQQILEIESSQYATKAEIIDNQEGKDAIMVETTDAHENQERKDAIKAEIKDASRNQEGEKPQKEEKINAEIKNKKKEKSNEESVSPEPPIEGLRRSSRERKKRQIFTIELSDDDKEM